MIIILDLQGIKNVMDACGPSALNTTLNKPKKYIKLNPIKIN
jgi:hypothetical protein